MAASLDEARAAKQKVARLLKRHPSVNGVGIARVGKGYGVKVNLTENSGPAIPKEIDGVPVRREVVGRITKRAAASAR
jgi:hypothetical protein